MEVFEEFVFGIVLMMAVLMLMRKMGCTFSYWKVRAEKGHFLFCPFAYGIERIRAGALYSVLFGIVMISSFVGHKFFTKKERELGEITARCGAMCSECSYFREAVCPSCPEGDLKLRESCPIFLCSLDKGISCSACEALLRCETFALKRGSCPFEKHFPLEWGMGYVIYEKNPEKSIELFKDCITRGEFGIVVSRQYPEQMKARHNLKKVQTIWLSTADDQDNWIDPCNLSKLHHVITDFIRNAPVSTVLFEGFEYLMVRNSFLTALKFVQSVMDEIILRKSRLLLSINADAFDTKELALIRRELVVL